MESAKATDPLELKCPRCGHCPGDLVGTLWAGPDADGIEATAHECGSCGAGLLFYRKTVTTYSVVFQSNQTKF